MDHDGDVNGSASSDVQQDEDTDSLAGKPCFWCGGGITLSQFTTKDDQLCELCSSVPFFELYHHNRGKYDPDKPTVVELGWLDQHNSNAKCPLCRLLVHCLRETYDHLLPTSCWQVGHVNGKRVKCIVEGRLVDDGSHNLMERSSAIGRLVFRTEPPLDLIAPRAGDLPSISRLKVAGAVVLAEGCLESRHNWSGVARRRLWADIDPELAKAWLSYCEKEHTILESKPGLPAHMRVVDLQTGCLVDVPIACRYVTLSYVWGGPQKYCLRQSSKTDFYQATSISSHNDSLPWTIRDFLTFVLAIGERYAWVDSLCIVQDDAKDIQTYVSSMHSIYENAVVTVVAAAGNSADAGLSGLRPGTRRSMQGREIIHRVAFGAPLPPLEEAIEHSPWKQRGWTYQEDILSRRLICFTDCQMHFKCTHGCTACEETWEDGHLETKDPKFLDLPKEERMHAYQPNLLTRKATTDVHHGIHTSLGWWYMHVREACCRQTTEPKDRLHAVEGILQYMKSIFDGHEFVWGHPTSALEVSLLWRPGGSKSEVSRNNAVDNTGIRIPSWSWAGWIGQISCRHTNICETAHSEVTWIDLNKSNTAKVHRFKVRTCGAPSQQWLEENAWQRHFVHKNTFPYYLKQGSEDIRYQHPITFARDQGPLRAVDMSTGEINFFSKSACFRMPARHIEEELTLTLS